MSPGNAWSRGYAPGSYNYWGAPSKAGSEAHRIILLKSILYDHLCPIYLHDFVEEKHFYARNNDSDWATMLAIKVPRSL